MKKLLMIATATLMLTACGGGGDDPLPPTPTDCTQEVNIIINGNATTTMWGYWEGDQFTPHMPSECKKYAKTTNIVDGDTKKFTGEYMEHGIHINIPQLGSVSYYDEVVDHGVVVEYRYRDANGRPHRINDDSSLTVTTRDDLDGSPSEYMWLWYDNGRKLKVKSLTYTLLDGEYVKTWNLVYMQNEHDSDDYESTDEEYIKQIEANLDPAYLAWY